MLPELDPGKLTLKDPAKMIWVRVQDAAGLLWVDNAKLHDIGGTIESIRRHGFQEYSKFDRQLPNVSGGMGGIKSGNGRLECLHLMERDGSYDLPRGLGITEAGEWCVQIIIGTDAETEAAAIAYAIDANNLTMAGSDFSGHDMLKLWEEDAYISLLARVSEAGSNPVSADPDFVDSLLSQMKPEEPKESPEPAAPKIEKAEELRQLWGVEAGQLWRLGEHLLICGDSRDPAILGRLMGEEKAVLLHADPPYGMGKENEGIANDNLYGEKLDLFQVAWWNACRPFLVDNASAYIWGNPDNLWRLWFHYLEKSERITFRNEIVWDKAIEGENETMMVTGRPMAGRRMFFPTERALFFMLGAQEVNPNSDSYWEGWEPIRSYLAEEVQKLGWEPKDIKRITGVGMFSHWFTKSQFTFITEDNYRKLQEAAKEAGFERDYPVFALEYEKLRDQFFATRAYFENNETTTDVWKFGRVTDEDRFEHAAPKPVEMVERAIRTSAPFAGIVLAPFSGTSPEIIASQRAGRVCRAIELLPTYTAVSLQRFQDTTGITPEKISE